MQFTLLVAALFAFVGTVHAAMAQGALNYTRDYVIKYDSSAYATSERFCQNFRSKCTSYVGARGYHHQLDCVYSLQKGPSLHAFCGGLLKLEDGSWINGSPVTDFTAEAVDLVRAKITGEPLGKAGCVKFAKKHTKAGIVC